MSDIFENKGALAATIVVAASDSLNKGAANYVASGAADDLEINAALAACNGGEVKLLEGNYVTVANIIVPADCKLSGAGFGTVITANHASITQAIVLNDRSTLSNLKVILAAGCGTAGARPNVVYATSETQIWVEDVWVVGDTSVADDGSDIRQCGILFVTVTDSKVVNCRIEDSDRHGINLGSSSDNNTITGNTAQGNTQYGIRVDTSSNNTITGNTCRGNGYSGISLSSSSNNTITGNTAQGNTYYGIYLVASLNNTITGNTVQGNTFTGIYLNGASNNNTVTGNVVQGNGRSGIYLSSSSNNTVTGNTCADNDSGGTTYSGIKAEGSNENVLTGNQCDGNGLHGIEILESSYCTVTGNTCVNQNTGDGINVTGNATTNADFNAIGSNTCTGNGDDGIAIEGGADANKNIVLSNTLMNNTGTALVDNGTNSNLGHNQVI